MRADVSPTDLAREQKSSFVTTDGFSDERAGRVMFLEEDLCAKAEAASSDFWNPWRGAQLTLKNNFNNCSRWGKLNGLKKQI